MRTAKISRNTKETRISVELNLDGTGAYDVATGVGFFDHMLEQLARHSLIDITVRAEGDTHIDFHHTVEDTGIALGQAVSQALGDMAGITRYADTHLAMDEALTRCAHDGRPMIVCAMSHSEQHAVEICTALLSVQPPELRLAAYLRNDTRRSRVLVLHPICPRLDDRTWQPSRL